MFCRHVILCLLISINEIIRSDEGLQILSSRTHLASPALKMLASPALKMEFLEELNSSKAITLNLVYMFLSLLNDIFQHRRMER